MRYRQDQCRIGMQLGVKLRVLHRVRLGEEVGRRTVIAEVIVRAKIPIALTGSLWHVDPDLFRREEWFVTRWTGVSAAVAR